jgi:hypothetical protein
MKTWKRQFYRMFWLGIALYSVAIMNYGIVLGSDSEPPIVVQYLIALLPTLAILIVLRATVSNVRHLDELEQRIQLEAVLITALLTGALTFGYGLLEFADLAPNLPLWMVLPMMFAIWGAASAIVRRRFQ